MQWIAPSEKDAATASLEKRLWDAADQFRANSGLKDEYRAINEDGSDYDDDVGGPAYVGGRGGVELEPIDAAMKTKARRAATALHRAIETGHEL